MIVHRFKYATVSRFEIGDNYGITCDFCNLVIPRGNKCLQIAWHDNRGFFTACRYCTAKINRIAQKTQL